MAPVMVKSCARKRRRGAWAEITSLMVLKQAQPAAARILAKPGAKAARAGG